VQWTGELVGTQLELLVAILALSDVRGDRGDRDASFERAKFAHEPAETLALAPSEPSASMAGATFAAANLHTLALRARHAQ
jgi:hypothetical protein